MNKVKISIWGREFDMNVIYDCYSGEEVLLSQKDAVKAFIKSEKTISESLDKVKEYCLLENMEEIGSHSIENIFKYVVPKYLYILNDNKKHVVSIMCNYKFDLENGIAVVFENEQLSRIGKQDSIL